MLELLDPRAVVRRGDSRRARFDRVHECRPERPQPLLLGDEQLVFGLVLADGPRVPERAAVTPWTVGAHAAAASSFACQRVCSTTANRSSGPDQPVPTTSVAPWIVSDSCVKGESAWAIWSLTPLPVS